MSGKTKKSNASEPDDLKRFSEGIRKSGFPHEYQTARTLKDEGWTVISSKYYLDDVTQTPREMDLIAYKVSTIQGFNVYTTLIVSCKKSESDVWALLSRKLDENNPNMEWWPLHLWTNNKAINYAISSPARKRQFHRDAERAGVKGVMSMPEVEVFAFQVMNASSGTVQNDKPIFDSIQSLGYAQAYELSALPDRKKAPAVYQFNLLTVVESDIVRLFFEEDNITPSLVNSEQYIARYIIQKQQTFSRINFVKASEFLSSLKNYNLVHKTNCQSFELLEREFFTDAVKDDDKTTLYIKEFRDAVRAIWAFLFLENKETINVDELRLTWNEDKNRVDLSLNTITDEGLEFLNVDKRTGKLVKTALKNVYRYTGDFEFIDDIPF